MPTLTHSTFDKKELLEKLRESLKICEDNPSIAIKRINTITYKEWVERQIEQLTKELERDRH